MNIVIPLGGTGQRFLDADFNIPKPLIKLLLKPIIFWVLDSLSIKCTDNVVIICNPQLRKYRFHDLVRKKNSRIKVVYLNKNTNGPVETILLGLADIKQDEPIILLDGDTFYNCDVLNMFRECENKNMIVSFVQEDDRPIYSYVNIHNNDVTRIVEKEKISSFANTGAYGFKSTQQLKKYCHDLIYFNEAQVTQQELYTSTVISNMIHDGVVFSSKIIKPYQFEVVGTPLQYRLFHNKSLEHKEYFTKLRICFDLDNTLVTYPVIDGDYSTVEPIENNIKYVQFLKELGCTIIVYTARRMKTHSGNIGSVMADVGNVTFKTLDKYNIPCDELYFGKPYAHAYVDDLAINADDDYQKLLGISDYTVTPRDFNTTTHDEKTFRKKSENIIDIRGEIDWYLNIPQTLKKYIPTLIEHDKKNGEYCTNYLTGVTCSEMLVSNSFTVGHLEQILEVLHKFHMHTDTANHDVNIYHNYVNKMTKRWQNFDYSEFTGAEKVFKYISERLNNYEDLDMGKKGIIHGDPVFSNILITESGDIFLVDPRGMVGNNTTIYGDIFYDYAKVLQSLMGYDEILITGRSKNCNMRLIDTLYATIEQLYGRDYIEYVKLITDSLIFSLIPLHNNTKCEAYYRLIDIKKALTSEGLDFKVSV